MTVALKWPFGIGGDGDCEPVLREAGALDNTILEGTNCEGLFIYNAGCVKMSVNFNHKTWFSFIVLFLNTSLEITNLWIKKHKVKINRISLFYSFPKTNCCLSGNTKFLNTSLFKAVNLGL